ncbi:nucleotidyltransferase domain-containing protein [uncultured Phascolarctobacterium sp.]|uniref:nucleotidyltransferase family protein n=1 Tax=uncultured Phascolarctobacterium sp. TaxID=512296 RepID=UPI002623A674|nr:nucleotidyltransferase domain-containing protein [uncultured Phascolarctobacterium sp.]
MTKKVYSIADIKAKLQPIFQKYNVKKAVLFGSYAKGNAKSNSDIDVMVESNLKGLAFYGLLEDIVNTIGKSVDLIDKSQIIASSAIQKEIETTGVVIYG